MVLNIIVLCQQALAQTPHGAKIDHSIWEEAQQVASQIVASIPFFLTGKVHAFWDQALSSDMAPKAIVPGPSVGGLLCMHTLYMVATLSVIDPALKDYLRNCLAWIGRNMGIGQATMLSEVSRSLSSLVTED